MRHNGDNFGRPANEEVEDEDLMLAMIARVGIQHVQCLALSSHYHSKKHNERERETENGSTVGKGVCHRNTNAAIASTNHGFSHSGEGQMSSAPAKCGFPSEFLQLRPSFIGVGRNYLQTYLLVISFPVVGSKPIFSGDVPIAIGSMSHLVRKPMDDCAFVQIDR